MCARQAATNCFANLTPAAISAGVDGCGFSWVSARTWLALTQVTGSLRSTPRGSQLTRLNLARREGENAEALCSRKSTPEAPGPPGFVNRSPRGLALVDGSITTARLSLPSEGFA